MRSILTVIFALCVSYCSFAQLSEAEKKHFADLEDSLQTLELRVFYSKKIPDRFEANKQFLAMWTSSLKEEKSIHYPFDSIKEVSRLLSPDKKFRIITWNLSLIHI